MSDGIKIGGFLKNKKYFSNKSYEDEGCQISPSDFKKVGQTLSYDNFVFECEKREDGMISWEPTACIHSFPEQNFNLTLKSSESAIMANGTVQIHCLPFHGAVRKVIEAVSGCYFNETVYPVGEQWNEPNPHKSNVQNVRMECFRTENGFFDRKIVGCADGSSDEFTEIGEFHVANVSIDSAENPERIVTKCVETEPGHLIFTPTTSKDLECPTDDVTRPECTWIDEKRAAIFDCQLGKVHKIGCSVKGISISLYQKTKLSNDCVLLCHPLANVYMCDEPIDNLKIEKIDN